MCVCFFHVRITTLYSHAGLLPLHWGLLIGVGCVPATFISPGPRLVPGAQEVLSDCLSE